MKEWMVLISSSGRSLSSGTASANLGNEYFVSQVDLRTRAVPEGVSRLPFQSTGLLMLPFGKKEFFNA
ncbi:hypothetical protein JOD43_004367 [Pullulanibacillus pueri]|nr:hypothetical protein [Pullulanibacillus pueri]